MATTTSPSTPTSDPQTACNRLVEGLAKEVTVPETPAGGTDVDSVASSLEKEDILAGFQDDILPEKENRREVSFLRHQVLTLYRKLFIVVFLTNLGVFVWFIVRGANALEIAGVTVANLFVSILHRQEYVINTYYWVCTRVPLS